MPTACVNGIELYYERRGDGPPVLFHNGSGSTLASMGVLLDVFAARVELLAHDQRGLGRTEIPPGPYSMADYAADAIDGIAPLENSETIAARVPNAQLRIYEGGHAFFAQDGRALTDVLDFLAG